MIVSTQQRNTIIRNEHACNTHSLGVFEKVEQASFVHQIKLKPRIQCCLTNVHCSSQFWNFKISSSYVYVLFLPGFGNGYVQWDDEDDDNKNNITGQLPDGDYCINTRIYFCCRYDGYATNVINLPTDKPFVLIKSDTHLYQIVNGTKMSEEYFRWDNEDDSGYIT